ncbi:MAG: hypothetical protein RLZZ387_1162 [Chloroflexota bacterium]
MSDRPLVSLVLITYNSAALLPAFFAALAQTRYAPYELIAVDNASSDGTPAALAREPGVRLLANATNVGFGRACNQGARAARGELLLFLNPDVLATPAWLEILARRMGEHPDAAIIAPQTLEPDAMRSLPPGSPHGRTENTSRLAGPRTAPRASPAPVAGRGGWGVNETAAVPGCAMMVRRAAWEALGGFDERIFLYWEDTELCWRAWLLGWRVLEDLEAAVIHARGGSGGGARWEAEATKNGLYVHLKLAPWPLTARYIARQALKTALRTLWGRGRELRSAWRGVLGGLGEALAQRRQLQRQARRGPAELARLISAHEARQRRERRERSR